MPTLMIGSGNVDRVAGACLAHFGRHVTFGDKSTATIDALEEDDVRIFEPGHAFGLVTECDEFRALDFKRLKKVVRKPILVELRNIYPIAEGVRHGFSGFAAGKKGGQ